MRSLIALAAVAMAAAVLTPRYLMHNGNLTPAPAVIAARTDAPTSPNPANSREIVLSPDSHGHFRVDGRVDARPLSFVVDTGATTIALTARDASALGIHPSVNDYTMGVQTANGSVRAAPVTLDRVEIGSIAIHDVKAIVLPEGALSDNLLGMTFLSRLHRYEYSNGRLVLEQ
jgi:aspartyl protease family protein